MVFVARIYALNKIVEIWEITIARYFVVQLFHEIFQKMRDNTKHENSFNQLTRMIRRGWDFPNKNE